MLPSDVGFWIVVAVLVAVVVAGLSAFAIWRGRKVEFNVSKDGLSFKTDEDAIPADTNRVLKDAKIDGKVRRIVGESSDGSDGDRSKLTEVGENMTIGNNAVVDEIVGREIRPTPKQSS